LAGESIGLPVALYSPAIETFRLQLGRYLEINRQRAEFWRSTGQSDAFNF